MANPLGCHTISAFSTATAFPIIDAGATYAVGSVETQNVRFRDDGTSPTASVGVLFAAGANFSLSENLAAVKFIPTTGSATINYCDYR